MKMLQTKLYHKTLLLAMPFFLSGCIYPAYKTIQPKATLSVVDEEGTPIKGAKVYLFSNLAHGAIERNSTKTAQKDGLVKFEQKKEWYMESLMTHGSHTFYWDWCVEKEGYESKFTRSLNHNDFKKSAKFLLREGTSTPCVSPSHRYFYPSFVKEYDFSKRYHNEELNSRVKQLIEKALIEGSVKEAYAELKGLDKSYVPYLILNMDDFRKLPYTSLSFINTSPNAFEGIAHYRVEKVVDLLSMITKRISNASIYAYQYDNNEQRQHLVQDWKVWLYLD